MKKWLWASIIFVIVVILGLGIWYFFFKKIPEGEACQNTKRCVEGLKCANSFCSSGKLDSSCAEKSDCESNLCVKNKCTEGKADDACATYKDCQEGLLCKNAICTNPPTYTKYFDKIEIGKIKSGMPPGPNNITVATTEFSLANDSIEIDITNSQKSSGTFWVEVIDPVTGEKIFTTDKQTINDSRGTGFGLPTNTKAREYELDVYFNDELIYSVLITVKV